MWPIENIPDSDHLFYRIHKNNIVDGEVVPGAFRERGEGAKKGMSTDWDKYTTPEESLSRSNNQAENGIVKFAVNEVRIIGSLEVIHDPDFERNNRAHTHIKGIPRKGQLKTKVRLKLKRTFKWSIFPEEVELTRNEFNFEE